MIYCRTICESFEDILDIRQIYVYSWKFAV